jgi:thioredoxin 1
MSITVVFATSLIAIFGIYLFYSFRKMKNMPMAEDHEKIKILTDQNFLGQIKTGLTLVDFWAEWCMPCKMMAPVLNEVASEFNGDAFVGKLNIEQHQAMAAKFKVRSIPTLILFKNGKEINRYVGVKSKEFLVNQLNQNK